MKDVHIRLPDRLYKLLVSAAAVAGTRPDDYATDVLVDSLVASQPQIHTSTPPVPDPPLPSGQGEMPIIVPPRPTTAFTCAGKFPGASSYSIQWAQQFVDAALRYDGVRASVSNEGGVAFDPNFVFIERVYTRDDGFLASFYGSITDFQRCSLTVEPGRTGSYSRVRVRSPRDVEIALGCIKVSARAKNLRTNA